MTLFSEAGVGAIISLGLFFVALVALARQGRVEPWATAILATGAIGAGLGQRLVAAAAEQAETLPEKIAIVAVGTREATANLIVAGTLAMMLVVVGAIATRMKSAEG